MAHFAKLNSENIVEQVIVVSNDIATTEQAGIEFLKSLYKDSNARWVQTSYNKNFRKNYAGIGYTYDKDKDAFISPKPYNSWILNEETCDWEAPVPLVINPGDNKKYIWNEQNLSWEPVDNT